MGIFLAFFIISLIIENYTLLVLSGMAFMVIGIYIFSQGMEGINNTLTYTLATILTLVGTYIILYEPLEQLKGYAIR